jgi:hypothetical protein
MAKGFAKRKAPASLKVTDPSGKKRLLTNEALVSTKLRDNFKGLSSASTDAVRGIDGRTLRERLLYDVEKAQKVGESIVFGKLYYDGLKILYEPLEDVHKALVPPKSSTCEVRPQLVKAMVLVQGSRVDRSGFEQFFTCCKETPNVKEICGVWRFAITLRVGCMKQMATAVMCLRFVARMGLHDAYPEYWCHVRTWADCVLVTLLRKSRYQKQRDAEFLDVHAPLVELVCTKHCLAKIAACKGEYDSVSAQLNELCDGSTLGRLLFETHQTKITTKKVAAHIEKGIHTMMHAKQTVSQDFFDAAQGGVIDLLERMPGIESLPSRREVFVTYRGSKLPIRVSTLAEEVQLKFMAAIKGIAVETDKLPKLWIEDLVVLPLSPLAPSPPLSEPMLKNATAARKTLKHMVSDASVSSSDVLAKLVGQKTQGLLLQDPAFKIELAVVGELTRSDDKGRLRESVIQALPTAKVIWAAESAVQKLQALEGTELFKLSSRSAQEKVRIAQNMVAAISEGRKPDVRAMGEDDFVATVVSACQWFVEHQDKSTDPPLYGKAALAKKLENLEVKKRPRPLSRSPSCSRCVSFLGCSRSRRTRLSVTWLRLARTRRN